MPTPYKCPDWSSFSSWKSRGRRIGVAIEGAEHPGMAPLVDGLLGSRASALCAHQSVDLRERVGRRLEVVFRDAAAALVRPSQNPPKNRAGNYDCRTIEQGTADVPLSLQRRIWLQYSSLDAAAPKSLPRPDLGATARPPPPGRVSGRSCRRRTWSLTQTRNMGCLAFFSTSMIRSCGLPGRSSAVGEQVQRRLVARTVRSGAGPFRAAGIAEHG